MRGRIFQTIALGLIGAMLLVAPAAAVPKVVTLGTGDASDPLTACGSLAASPFEAGWTGKGAAADSDIFLDGARSACEAALAANPESPDAKTWLARVYILIGREADAYPLLDAAANAGSPFAAFLLGELLDKPVRDDVDDDPERAVLLLKQAADAGFAPAEAALAKRYEAGTGVDLDPAEALRLYSAASDSGDAFATYKLGYFAHNAIGGDADYERAMTLYKQAADGGEALGYNGIGQLYQFGQGVEIDNAQAAEAYQHGADQNEMMSQTALAYLYEQGMGVTQDFDKSFALLTDAANQGYGMAEAALAIHYLAGQGTPVDNEKAFALAWSAVEKSVNYAQGILGYLYAEGLGTDRDLASALLHFETGSQGGDQFSTDRVATTQTELACQDAAGSQYEPGGIGHGVDFDAIDAPAAIDACQAALAVNAGSVGDKVWLARAFLKAGQVADAVPLLEEGLGANNVLAQTLYAELLAQGNGVDADQARALALYEAAAGKHYAPAEFALGDIYANGRGVAVDKQVAIGWYRRAMSSGIESADLLLAELEGSGNAAGIDLTGFGREGPGY